VLEKTLFSFPERMPVAPNDIDQGGRVLWASIFDIGQVCGVLHRQTLWKHRVRRFM